MFMSLITGNITAGETVAAKEETIDVETDTRESNAGGEINRKLIHRVPSSLEIEEHFPIF